MNIQTLSGILLIAGLPLMIAASIAGPPGLFLAPDREAQLEIIDKFPSRFNNISILAASAGIVTATGLILLSRLLTSDESSQLLNVGASGFALGSVFFAVFYYLMANNPQKYFESIPIPAIAVAAFWLIVTALAIYGIAFLQLPFPNWLGYLHIGAMVVLAILAVIYQSRFFTAFPPQIIFLFTCITGIVLLLSRGKF